MPPRAEKTDAMLMSERRARLVSILKRLKLPEAELWTLTQIKRSRYLYTHPNPIICGPFEGLTEAKEAHIAAFPAAAAALSDRELEVFARDCDAFLGAKP
jgi:hypothetical protein